MGEQADDFLDQCMNEEFDDPFTEDGENPNPVDITRTFFGKPTRAITEILYSHKMHCGNFCAWIGLSPKNEFLDNMKHLGIDRQEKYIEEWTETFLAWMDIEQDDDTV